MTGNSRDIPVRYEGRRYRLIAEGQKAALFGKSGPAYRLDVTEYPQNRIPTMTLDGEPFSVSRTARPCSCSGAPWSTSFRDLADAL